MPRAICEDCGSLVEAELTHNGICAVGHYVHCGWGHELSPDDLISDDVAEIISMLEAKLAKAVEGQKVNALEQILEERGAVFDAMVDAAEDAAGKDVSFNVVVGRALRAAIAEIKGESHE